MNLQGIKAIWGTTVAGKPAPQLNLRVNDHGGAAKETGYSITKSREINLMPDRYQQQKRQEMRQKNKREREAPQSGIQMLFIVLCSLRSTGPSYASPP
ncbi:hypothetical protein CJP16_00520 [Aeromonas sobria]|uniref:Uncharacterized protein n=1 Tax=Aeromonas sobria TaxID=646 RepID=A0A2N3J9Y8_AERSO|nr:hypothetical protein [Aeromonas sobria]PKQ83376.1 hypothetical protein CJP16_00520 [Aeromonas sobria]